MWVELIRGPLDGRVMDVQNDLGTLYLPIQAPAPAKSPEDTSEMELVKYSVAIYRRGVGLPERGRYVYDGTK